MFKMTITPQGSLKQWQGLGMHWCEAVAGSAAALVTWEVASSLTSSIFNKAVASVSLGTAVYFGVKEIQSFFQKKSELPGLLVKPTKEFSERFATFLQTQEDEVTSLIWSFLDIKDVGSSLLVSKCWKDVASSNYLWAILHAGRFSSENRVPSGLMIREAVTAKESKSLRELCKTRCLETDGLFPNKMGSEFYSEYLGDVVKVPPIPAEFITRAQEVDPFDVRGRLVKDTHQLVYVPREITIKIPAGSNLILNENGRLVEVLEIASLEERTFTISVTINNISMLMDKCLKKGHKTRIYEDTWNRILEEHGDKPEEAHWSYLRKGSIGASRTYQDQTTLVENKGYEVASLRDRVILEFFTYARSGTFIDGNYVARTSTSIVYNERTYQLASRAFGPRLGLFHYFDDDYVGVAVEVPSGSSAVLGT